MNLGGLVACVIAGTQCVAVSAESGVVQRRVEPSQIINTGESAETMVAAGPDMSVQFVGAACGVAFSYSVFDDFKDKANHKMVIEVTYVTEVEVSERSIGNLHYGGQFGDVVVLRSENTTLNGEPVMIKIAKGQQLSSGQLAALRVVSTAGTFHAVMKGYDISDRYVLTTAKEQTPQTPVYRTNGHDCA